MQNKNVLSEIFKKLVHHFVKFCHFQITSQHVLIMKAFLIIIKVQREKRKDNFKTETLFCREEKLVVEKNPSPLDIKWSVPKLDNNNRSDLDDEHCVTLCHLLNYTRKSLLKFK